MQASRTLFSLLTAFSLASSALAAECIIKGKVKDEGGKGIPEVQISVDDPGTGRHLEGTTDKKGSYYMRGIPPSDYEIKYEKEGYTNHVWTGHLAPGKPIVIDIQLQSKKAIQQAVEQQAMASLGKDFDEALEKYRAQDYDGAIAIFKEIAEKKPGLPDTYYNIGLCYQKKKDYGQAAEWLQKTVDIKPDHAGAQFNLAFALYKTNQPESGLAAAKTASELDQTADTAYNCGALLKNFSQTDDALAMFDLALTRDPSYADAYREKAYLLIGKTDMAGAKEALTKYLELRPDAPDAAEVKSVLSEL